MKPPFHITQHKRFVHRRHVHLCLRADTCLFCGTQAGAQAGKFLLRKNFFYAEGVGFFKYYELEQYEEALANCKYEDSDLFNSPSKTPYQEYVFMKDEKMLKALEIDYEKEKVTVDLAKLYPEIPRQASPDTPLQKGNIDIAETLSNLTGKWIKKISDSEVEFEDETKIDIKNLDYKLIKPLIWWE